ncbi:hypothetical protein HRbin22_02489 [Candidatus Thermoflexus japonica]|uniref:Uncharacterized protein n=1 Tax=Candidatus Thermoflexus japonica TaxID=2035417 RepID=A0A2H5Y9V6_9CHLR|nr:hypothetical protein HRbin22_02489 [Candidatus Thermoflexus japonica]
MRGALPLRRLTAGILMEDERVELVEGVIREMPPISSAHTGAVNRLVEGILGGGAG